MTEHILQVNINNRGGAFSLMYQAARELYPDFVFDFYSADLFFQDSAYSELLEKGSRIYSANISKGRFLKQLLLYRDFLNCLRKNNYRVVHIHTDTAWKGYLYARAARKAQTKRVIVHSHSSGINGHYRGINHLLHLAVKNGICKAADIKCACSEKAAKWMFHDGTTVNYIQNGIDLEKYKFNEEMRKKIRNDLGIGSETVVIGTAGDFSYAKNPEFTGELINELSQNKKYAFLLIGTGSGKKKLRAFFTGNTLPENVFDIPQVTNMEDYLSAMDIFVLPSRFEGLPISALEAQASGCYTIVSGNVSSETRYSSCYASLPLDIKKWMEKIQNVELNLNRKKQDSYLNIAGVSIKNAARQLRRIYGK